MKKLLLILNPNAGMRHARRFLPEIVSLFTGYGWQNLVYVTEKQGDAARFACDYGQEAGCIVCIGGDGTFNEVVDGMLRAGLTVPVGYIPAGSTNDFAASLRLSNDVMTAARNIMEGAPRTLDIGRFDGRHFSYVASFGAFTRASYATPQNIKNALGHMAYIFEGMKDLPSIIRPERVALTADGRTFEGDYIFGAVSNSTSLGGVLTLDPEIVDLNDGMFEIILIRMPRTALEMQGILTALGTRQYDCDMIDFIRTSRAEVRASADMDWSLDGEHASGKERILIENVHNAISLLTVETAKE